MVPRTLAWAGSADGAFAGAGNWADQTGGTSVATEAVPGTADLAILGQAGITVTGPGLVGALRVTQAATLAGSVGFGSLDIAAALLVAAGGTLTWQPSLVGTATVALVLGGALTLAGRLSVTSGTTAWAELLVADGGTVSLGTGAVADVDLLDLAAQRSVDARAVIAGGAILTGDWLAAGDGGGGSATLTGGASVHVQLATAGFADGGIAGHGTISVTDAASLVAGGYAALGFAAGDSGTLLVQGAGVTSAGLFIGNAGSGTLTVQAGATLATGIEAGDATQFAGAIANLAGSSGQASVTGAGALWTLAGRYDIGAGGAAALDIGDGGVLRCTAIPLAGATGSPPNIALGQATVAVSGAGSTLDAGPGALWVGSQGTASLAITAGAAADATSPAASFAAVVLGLGGGVGRLSLADGGSAFACLGQLDVGGGGGTGSLAIGAGATLSSGNDAADAVAGLSIADAAGSAGVVTIAGAAALLTNSGRFDVGRLGAGLLAVGAGGVVQTVLVGAALDDQPGGVLVGTGAGAAGTIEVAGVGAALGMAQSLLIGIAGSGTLAVSAGGAVQTDGDLDVASPGQGVALGSASGLVTVAQATLEAFGDLWVGERDAGYVAVGTLDVAAGGVVGIGGEATLAAGSTISVAGGALEIGGSGVGVGAGVTVDDGATLAGSGVVQATVQGAGTLALLAADATLDVAALASATIDFVAGGTLRLHAAPVAASLLVGPDGGTIDLAGIVLNGARYAEGALVLQPAQGAPTIVALAAAPPAGVPSWRPDGSGGTDVVLPCFAAGTRIRTARGEVAAERLRPGDRVLTAAGRWRPVIWVGARSVDCRRHARPWDVHPVRLSAGALAEGVPTRALTLSPDHAVLVAGLLVPVRYLLNGRTVVQTPVACITYVHVELDGHDLLLAEGAAAESYLDTGNRAGFTLDINMMMPQSEVARAIWRERGCAALVTEGPALLRARRAVLARARALGHRRTGQPRLQLFVGDVRLRPQVAGAQWRVALPPAARSVRLASRAWVPAHTRAAECDTRRLGVALASVRLDGACLPLDDAALASGWHAAEPAWRWTDGEARLRVRGVREVAFALAMNGTYWAEPGGVSGPAASEHRLRTIL